MQSLTDRHGYPPVERATRVLSIQLSARPETAPLAAEIDALRVAARAAEDAWQEAQSQRVAASATIVYLDSLLDDAIADLARDVLAAVGGDRASTTWRLLFPSAPSTAMRPTGSAAQAAFVKGVLSALASPPLADWADRAGPIADRLAQLEAGQAARADLFVTEGQASTRRALALDELRQAYNLAYSRLRVQFPKKKALVESFFPAL